MKSPISHFDFLRRRSPEGGALYEAIKKQHQSFSLHELTDGRCATMLERLDATSRMCNYLMLLYDRFGQNSYVLGPKVQDLFARTNLIKVTPEMVKPPQTGFYVSLADCPWRIWGGRRTRWHQLAGIYVGFTAARESEPGSKMERRIHFALWGLPNDSSVTMMDDAWLWYSVNLEEWGRREMDLESFFESQKVMLNHEEDFTKWSGGDPLDSYDDTMIPPNQVEVEEHRATLGTILRLVLNLCLYLSSDEPDIEVLDARDEQEKLKQQITQKKSGGKRKKLERRMANLPKTRVVYVGPLFEKVGSSHSGGPSQGGTHASPLEHAVRPHWQRYWVGVGDQRRERWTLKGMYVRGTGQPSQTVTKFRE